MATTTNFGWETPDDTDLVKDGALAMRTLGNAIDASMVDLKGGTTGQVLSKASNTDMDFTWVAQDDSNAIQNAIVDAKGDLISATAADTPARLAVGNNGETLVADSSASTGLRWQGDWNTGKNKIINGAMDFWQRGTSFSNPKGIFTADRYAYNYDGTGNITISQQTFTPGAAPVAGYEGQFFLRVNQTTAGSGTTFSVLQQPIEDVRTLANQVITVSFWAKADASRSVTIAARQDFGSGGSTSVDTQGATLSLTTSWVRYTSTITLPSISGKTIGTGSALRGFLYMPLNQTFTIDIWGLQIESGSVATPFTRAAGTLAGELAACQRYYVLLANGNTQAICNANNYQANEANGVIHFPVAMRTTPTIAQTTGTDYYIMFRNAGTDNFNSLTVGRTQAGNTALVVYNATEISGTAGHAGFFSTNNASSFLAFQAEL